MTGVRRLRSRAPHQRLRRRLRPPPGARGLRGRERRRQRRLIGADSFWAFVAAAGLQGVFRALDSGPLEAWYVDTVHVTEPGADVDRALAAPGRGAGGSIALGAVISGGLIAWDPFDANGTLLPPMVAWAVLNVVHLVAVLVAMKEPRTHLDVTGPGVPRTPCARCPPWCGTVYGCSAATSS